MQDTITALWRTVEAYHAPVYFAPQRPHHYQALGLKGGWMGYFATRSAALGRVPAAVVTACFYNFSHAMVARALPDAWRYTTPELAIQARLAVFDAALRQLLDDRVGGADLTEAAALAVAAVGQCDPAGRPLFAAHAAVPVPDEAHLALFWATAALREFRGDAHVAALAAADVDGCEANILMAALGLVPAEQRQVRGYTEDDWNAGLARLTDRGWTRPDGTITPSGRRARADIERVTDRLAAKPWTRLGPDATTRFLARLTPPVARIITGGGVPYPNAIGVAAVPELAATR